MIASCLRVKAICTLVALAVASGEARTSTPYVFQKKWTPGEVGVNLGYGYDVAAEGSLCVVSAPDHDPVAQGQACNQIDCSYGAIFVLERTGATWTFRQKIESPVPACVVPGGVSPPTASFGRSVAVDAPTNRIAVSCLPTTSGERSRGAVFIFEPDTSGKFVKVARVDPPPEVVPEDSFGYEIALDGNVLVVGAPRQNVVGQTNQGRVYVYERDALGVWILTATISETSSILLGDSVAVEGDTLIAGAPREHTSGFWAGAAYVYRRNAGGSWSQIQHLLPPVNSGSYFGESVALSVRKYAVGAPFYPSNREGRIYVYDEHAGWSQSVIYPANVQPNDEFGSVVSMTATTIGGWSPLATFLGQVTLFDDTAFGWVETQQLSDTVLAPFGSFGLSFAIVGDFVIIGSPNQDPNPNFTPKGGAHYVFAKKAPSKFTFPRMGCAGTAWFVPELTLDGVPAAGGYIEIQVANSLGGASALLLVGFSETTRLLCSPGQCCFCSLGLLFLPNILIPIPMTPGGPGQGTFGPVTYPLPPVVPSTPVLVQVVVPDSWTTYGYVVSNTARFDL